jgi:hypothetical protein
MYVQGVLGYTLLPVAFPLVYAEGLLGSTPPTSLPPLSIVSLGAGAGLMLKVLPWATLKLLGVGGVSLSFLQASDGADAQWHPYFGAEVSTIFSIAPTIGVGIGVGYSNHMEVFSSFGVLLWTELRPQPSIPRFSISISSVTLNPVFPVLYKYYDDHPIGSVVINNTEKGPIQNIRVSFYIEQYMSQPKECMKLERLEKGAEMEVPLYGLFRDDIMTITQDTKVPAQVIIEYTYMDTPLSGTATKTLRIHHRIGVSWDDDRKAATFVTAQDLQLLRFTKSAVRAIEGKEVPVVDQSLRDATGLFESLRIYGVGYVPDPSSSFAERSGNSTTVDYLQFPVETLSYKAGDCDDLSILYAAMLESIGVETAFITIPGHIYVAFALTGDIKQSRNLIHDPVKVIEQNGKAWIPVEVTMIKDGFLRAWQEGARKWVENDEKRQAGFCAIHEAWATYEPVAYSEAVSLGSINLDALGASWLNQLSALVEQAIQKQAEDLLAQISILNNDPKLTNRLGVLYAHYGLFDKAEQQLSRAAEAGYVPAIVNLGNIAYLRNRLTEALSLYRLAAEKGGERSQVLLGIARTSYQLEDYASAKDAYQKLESLDSSLARQNDYLTDMGKHRASRTEQAEMVEWLEE